MTKQLDLYFEFPSLDEFVEQVGEQDRAALLGDDDEAEKGDYHDQGPDQR